MAWFSSSPDIDVDAIARIPRSICKQYTLTSFSKQEAPFFEARKDNQVDIWPPIGNWNRLAAPTWRLVLRMVAKIVSPIKASMADYKACSFLLKLPTPVLEAAAVAE
jgi:hypothetical protein